MAVVDCTVTQALRARKELQSNKRLSAPPALSAKTYYIVADTTFLERASFLLRVLFGRYYPWELPPKKDPSAKTPGVGRVILEAARFLFGLYPRAYGPFEEPSPQEPGWRSVDGAGT